MYVSEPGVVIAVVTMGKSGHENNLLPLARYQVDNIQQNIPIQLFLPFGWEGHAVVHPPTEHFGQRSKTTADYTTANYYYGVHVDLNDLYGGMFYLLSPKQTRNMLFSQKGQNDKRNNMREEQDAFLCFGIVVVLLLRRKVSSCRRFLTSRMHFLRERDDEREF